jgi:signal transduction histidine kinase
VLQECLTNVHRHSGSDKVDVSLMEAGNQIVLRVRDYGRGVSPENMSLFREIGTGAGVGLGGMRQRIRELGGQLTIESDGNGTTVVASIPLERCLKPEEHGVQLRNSRSAA